MLMSISVYASVNMIYAHADIIYANDNIILCQQLTFNVNVKIILRQFQHHVR